MKLPPAALTAPSLCPRCDAPALMTDHCVQCALPLRQCGSCRGIAGPFDRFCGFCGYELIRGRRRSGAWRLWLVAALVPLVAGIVAGQAALGTATRTVAHGGSAAPTPAPGSTTALKSDSLGFAYAVPREWVATDYTRASDPARVLPWVAATKVSADQQRVSDAKGDLLALRPQGTVVELGRPPADLSAVDPTSPESVLAFQVAPLLASPPQGVKVESFRPVAVFTVDGKPGAEAVLRITRDGAVAYLVRSVVYAPRPGQPAVFRVDALVPSADWEGGDSQRVDQVIRSLRFA